MSDHETSVLVPEDEQQWRRIAEEVTQASPSGRRPMMVAQSFFLPACCEDAMLTLLDRLTALRERLRMSDKGYAIRTAEAARLTEENQRLRGRVEELERLVVEPHDVMPDPPVGPHD